MRHRCALLSGVLAVLVSMACPSTSARAQENDPTLNDRLTRTDPSAEEGAPADTTRPSVRVGHGPGGVEIETEDGRFLIQIQPRLQFRVTGGTLGDTVLADRVTEGVTFGVNRARIKIGGHAFTPNLTYFFEYELQGNALLDFRVQYRLAPGVSLKVGQWKLHYSRERVISSGQQQMMDRSLINPIFTLDRQQGLSLYGRVDGGGLADFSYWGTVATGTGRAGESNDDSHPLLMGRLHWNVLGDPIGFSGSDLAMTETPALLIAAAAATNRSPYTRFSQAGGGQLPGFDDGEAGQYRLNQWTAETAFKYRGVSWQQELHWKRVDDTLNDVRTTLVGNYVQIGVVLGAVWDNLPRQLELAVRHAFYDPEVGTESDIQQEVSLTANWFFNGHLNKLSAELLWLTADTRTGDDKDSFGARLQWDISM
jgi:phosphate-selective porin